MLIRKPLLGALLVAVCLGASPLAAEQVQTSPTAQPGFDFAALAKPLIPAVVNISSERVPARGEMRGRPDSPGLPPGLPRLPPPFDQLIPRPPGGEDEMPGPRGTALGSGFLVDPSGLVVTNNHVVEDATEITVTLHDEREFPAKLLGRDALTDLALLKIETNERLPFVKWGDSDQAQVGEWVLAIGNPFGLGGSVTAGILSALARDIGSGPYDAYLQTDASINRGNSGGPLFNTRGEVIGINTAIFSPTGGSIGIGFAIPSSLAQGVIQQLSEKGEVSRGWLGVAIQQVTPEIAQGMGLEKARGALVADVTKDSPADKAGIRTGDVILAWGDQVIDESHRLPRMVAETPIGSKHRLTVLRGDKEQVLEVTVGRLDRERQQAASRRPEEPAAGELGLALSPLTDEARAQLGLGEDVQGVLVRGVQPGSTAAEKGLRPGDVIVQVAQQPVKDPAEVKRIIEQSRGEGKGSVLLLVRREDSNRFVALSLKPEKAG